MNRRDFLKVLAVAPAAAAVVLAKLGMKKRLPTRETYHGIPIVWDNDFRVVKAHRDWRRGECLIAETGVFGIADHDAAKGSLARIQVTGPMQTEAFICFPTLRADMKEFR